MRNGAQEECGQSPKAIKSAWRPMKQYDFLPKQGSKGLVLEDRRVFVYETIAFACLVGFSRRLLYRMREFAINDIVCPNVACSEGTFGRATEKCGGTIPTW